MAGGVISNKKPCHSLDWFFCEVEVALRVALYCILFRDVIKYSPPLYHINQILPPFQSFCKLLLSCLRQRLSLVWLSPVEFRNSGNCRNYGQRCRCMAPPLWKSGILEIKRIMGRYDISLCRKLLGIQGIMGTDYISLYRQLLWNSGILGIMGIIGRDDISVFALMEPVWYYHCITPSPWNMTILL